ncbi:lamin tail domain-containing protein, partial [Pseudomonas aeruginosa]
MKTFQLKTLSIFLSALGAFSYSSVAQAQLMFSQYVDGSSNKKGLEIYNPDGTTVNLA